jgi:serine/threonine protein kinase
MAYSQDIGRFVDRIYSGGANANVRIASGDSVSENSFKRYTLLEPLGIGGFGFVMKAKSNATNEDVAIKCCYIDDLMPDEERTERYDRFKTEARLSKLMGDRSDNVVRVIDSGIMMNETGRLKVPCLIEDYVGGASLDDLILLRSGSLNAEEIYVLMREIALGLGEGHKIGILHRDIKPSNILVDKNQLRVKITDFGISYDKEEKTERTIVAQNFRGTIAYISKYNDERIYDVEENEVKNGEGGKKYCIRDRREISVGFDTTEGKHYRRFQGPQIDIMPLASIILPELFIGTNIYMGMNDRDTYENITHKIKFIDMARYKDRSETLRALKSKALRKLNSIVNKGKADDILESYSCADELLEDLADFARIQFGEQKSKDEEKAIIRNLLSHTLENGCREASNILIQNYMEGTITKDTRNRSRLILLSRLRSQEDYTQKRIEEIFKYTERKVKDSSTSKDEISYLNDLWSQLSFRGIKPEYEGVVKKLKDRAKRNSGGDTA